jgi:hypothetical protein
MLNKNMKIIAHRGYWLNPEEKNTVIAFERALNLGFGIETDLRDAGGEIVISHDMPCGGEMNLQDFFGMCVSYPIGRPLALNIKSDGLRLVLKQNLEQWGIAESEYFVFDMSFPDAISYIAAGLPAYTRISEYETTPILISQMSGVWVDAFHSEWYVEEDLSALLKQGKKICIVSPELHGRPHMPLWVNLKKWKLHISHQMRLCTDFPMLAKEFFCD